MENTEIPTPTVEIQNTPQRSKTKLWIIIFLVIFCLGIITVLIKLSASTSQKGNDPVATTTYHDRGGYFSVQIPKNWQTSEDIAQGTTGVGTSEQATQNIEEAQLDDGKETGITIQVYEGKPSCPLDQPVSTTMAGYPASYDIISNTWTIPTTKALITVTISYPGSGVRHNLQQTVPTAIPSAIVEQEKDVVTEMLKTLKLTNLAPFSC